MMLFPECGQRQIFRYQQGCSSALSVPGARPEIHFYPRASPDAPGFVSVNFKSPWPANSNPCWRERLDGSTEHPTDTLTETKDLERVSAEQQLLQQVIQ
jgi:hypothetical protein